MKNIRTEIGGKWYYIVSALFIGLNAVSILLGFEYFSLLAFVLAFAWFALFAFDKIYYFIVFFTPLSIPLSEFYQLPFDLSVPAEAMMIVLSGILIMKFLFGSKISSVYVKHPVSISVFFYLAWMFYTSIISTMPLVSFKYFLAKIWFIVPLYFFSFVLFQKRDNIYKVLWLYILPLFLVIIYTILNHLSFGLFDKQASHWVMSPFYNDHTAYGAVLSMYLPVLFGFLLFRDKDFLHKIPVLILFVVFCIALLLSYSRAAWISLLLSVLLGTAIYLKIKLKYLFITVLFILSLLYIYRFEIIDRLEKNRQDSSAEFKEQIQSATNIATDASNLERINRWKSGLAMFPVYPLTGWGPGSYQFQYAPYQLARDKTIISTDFGEGGTEHSEYLTALIDSGFPGLIFFLMILFFVLKSAYESYFNINDRNTRILIWSVSVGFISYLIHGFLNNFLDTDKANVPFWSFAAIIVYLHIHEYKKNLRSGGTGDS